MTEREDLADACGVWQSGRDHGSSRLRGAARVLTDVPHYFRADFIDQQQAAAGKDPAALARARVLLDAIAASTPVDADGWRGSSTRHGGVLAGRGLQSKPQDQDILKVIDSGEIDMPLWGVSLDPAVAQSFGKRFLFQIEGPFHGVAAWRASGLKEDQQEIITGGHYTVVQRVDGPGGTTRVVLAETGSVWPVAGR